MNTLIHDKAASFVQILLLPVLVSQSIRKTNKSYQILSWQLMMTVSCLTNKWDKNKKWGDNIKVLCLCPCLRVCLFLFCFFRLGERLYCKITKDFEEHKSGHQAQRNLALVVQEARYPNLAADRRQTHNTWHGSPSRLLQLIQWML